MTFRVFEPEEDRRSLHDRCATFSSLGHLAARSHARPTNWFVTHTAGPWELLRFLSTWSTWAALAQRKVTCTSLVVATLCEGAMAMRRRVTSVPSSGVTGATNDQFPSPPNVDTRRSTKAG